MVNIFLRKTKVVKKLYTLKTLLWMFSSWDFFNKNKLKALLFKVVIVIINTTIIGNNCNHLPPITLK